MPRDRLDGPVIVVLGGPNDDQGHLLPVSRERAVTAVREHRRDPAARLVLTGGFGAHFNTTASPHHAHVEAHLLRLGVPASAILARLATGNTVEDAERTADFLMPYGRDLELRVVTSDFHLARARLLFERAFGDRAHVEMIAAPSGLPADELQQALRHEADAIGRLTAPLTTAKSRPGSR